MSDSAPVDRVHAVGCTDVGQRGHNEDAVHINDALGLMIVADGVGGHQAGEVASGITCESIAREIGRGAPLVDAIRTSNREVMAAVEDERGNRGMASTVVAVHFHGADYQIAWVGDSRAYLWDGQLKLLTQDHSYVQSLLISGQITLAQAREHPRKNVIVQAIGLQGDENLQVDQNQGSLRSGQILLLCSDGFSDVIDSAATAAILAEAGEDLQGCCDEMVASAVRAGGRDNISVVLVSGQFSADVTEILRPTVYWTFDPASGEYIGLPQAESYEPSVRKVMPRRAEEEPLGTTQLISATQIAEMLKELPEAQQPRSRRVFWWLVGIGTIVAASLIFGLVKLNAG